MTNLEVIVFRGYEEDATRDKETINVDNGECRMMLSSVCSCHQIKDGFDCRLDSANDLDDDNRYEAISQEKSTFSNSYIKESTCNLSSLKEEIVGMNLI